LSEEALDLFSQETVGALKQGIEKGMGPKGRLEIAIQRIEKGMGPKIWLETAIQPEIAKGVEDIILLLHQRLNNSQYLKDKLYGLMHGMNEAFSKDHQTEKEKEEEFLKVEERFFTLLNSVLAQAIQNGINQRVASFGIQSKGAFFDEIQKRIFKHAYGRVEKVIDMGFSPQFLNFVVREALGDFFSR
nr:hypothetical protein [Chlamydiota bacterium]